jgi:hypothetical protein
MMTGDDMADQDKKAAAVYVSWTTFKNALDQLSQGIPPNRIDRTVFPGLAWSIQNQLFAGLRFLGLIDDASRPTAELEALVGVDEQFRKEKLRAILRQRYAELFALDLKKTTPGELAQKMSEAYRVTGETGERAVRFFTSAAGYVGTELSPLFGSGRKTNGGGVPRTARRKRPKAPPHSAEEATQGDRSATSETAMKTIELPRVGGTLTISGTFNPFGLFSDERDLVYKIIDMMGDFEAKAVLRKQD